MLRLLEMLGEIPNSEVQCLSLNDNNVSLKHGLSNTLHNIRGFNRSKLRFVLYQLLQKRADNLVIVGHLHLAPVALAAKLLGRIRGYIIILHGIEAWQRHSWLRRWAMNKAICNVATTHFTADRNTHSNNVPAERHHVIPLSVDTYKADTNRTFTLNGEFRLLMVARLDKSERYKGAEMVFEAVARLRKKGIPVHFNLVGQGNDFSRLKQYAADLGCKEHVTFWGTLNAADLRAAYLDADIFVMPSKKEGFGIVFLEAMKHGVPCIGGRHGGTPEVIRDRVTGFLVDYGDVDALSHTILDLIEDGALRASIIENAMKSVETEFSFRTFVTRWEGLLTSLE
jgi:glycosyltransferase involved in cell wall biosynthesis